MSQVDHFVADTAVNRVDASTFTANMSDRWDALGGTPNGGYLLSVVGRAISETLPFDDPFAVSAHYLRPARTGAATIETEQVRAGRRLATGEARLLQEGKEIVRALGTFGTLSEASGRSEALARPPDLPAPEDCIDLMENGGIPGVTIAERCDYRAPRRPGWAEGKPSGDPRLEFWMRLKGRTDHEPLALLTLVDAAAPAVLELGEFASATVEMTVHVRDLPASGWLACRVATRHVARGYHEEDFEIWDSDGTLVAQSRQLALHGA